MSIRPADLQVIVQRTQEIERLQQTQQQQPRIQQQHFAEQLSKQTVTKERQVASSTHADEVEIHSKERDAGGRQHDKDERERPSDAPASEHEERTASTPEHIIDIKI